MHGGCTPEAPEASAKRLGLAPGSWQLLLLLLGVWRPPRSDSLRSSRSAGLRPAEYPQRPVTSVASAVSPRSPNWWSPGGCVGSLGRRLGAWVCCVSGTGPKSLEASLGTLACLAAHVLRCVGGGGVRSMAEASTPVSWPTSPGCGELGFGGALAALPASSRGGGNQCGSRSAACAAEFLHQPSPPAPLCSCGAAVEQTARSTVGESGSCPREKPCVVRGCEARSPVGKCLLAQGLPHSPCW